MTRKDSEEGLWFNKSYGETRNHLAMREVVAMAEDHYTNIDVGRSMLRILGYTQDKQIKREPHREADTPDKLIKQESQGEADTQDNQVKQGPEGEEVSLTVKPPEWMGYYYDFMGKSMSGLEIFTLASVIIDSGGTSWHLTDVEFANLTPSPVYLTKDQIWEIALKNILLNNKSPKEIYLAIKARYSTTKCTPQSMMED